MRGRSVGPRSISFGTSSSWHLSPWFSEEPLDDRDPQTFPRSDPGLGLAQEFLGHDLIALGLQIYNSESLVSFYPPNGFDYGQLRFNGRDSFRCFRRGRQMNSLKVGDYVTTSLSTKRVWQVTDAREYPGYHYRQLRVSACDTKLPPWGKYVWLAESAVTRVEPVR